MSYKICIDSCGELRKEWLNDPRFESIPLTLQVGDAEIVDDETFDQAAFLKKVASTPQCPRSACPSPEKYRKAFDCGADHVYAVTLSAELSGSYNSAVLAREMIIENEPDRKIYVFNSRSASIGETLIGMKIQELEEAGTPFEEIIEKVEAYIETQVTYFVLENLDFLRKNGRLTGVKALVALTLKIKPYMCSTPEGTIRQMGQARGINRAIDKLLDAICENTKNPSEKILAISHCNCPERAEDVKRRLDERMNPKDSFILDQRGVSSLYAGDHGFIVVI